MTATVWVAVATYAHASDGIDPILVVGDTADAATRALIIAVAAHCADDEDPEIAVQEWIEENPVELPINR